MVGEGINLSFRLEEAINVLHMNHTPSNTEQPKPCMNFTLSVLGYGVLYAAVYTYAADNL